MIRQFLALVAILTGLTTLAGPAQARISGLDDVSVQSAGEAANEVQLVAVCAVICAQFARYDTVAASPFLFPETVVVITPALMMQVDRAHE